MANFILLAICFAAGIMLRRGGKLPADTPGALNTYIIYIAFPSLALLHIHSIKISPSLIIPISMAWLLFGLSVVFFNYLGKKYNWSRGTIACMILTCGLGNTSFVGMPMIEAFYGRGGIPIGLIIDVPGSFLVLSTLGITAANFYSGTGLDKKTLARRIITFPPFIALFAAAALLPVEYPSVVVTVLDRLGGTLAPVALVSVGYQMKFSHLREYIDKLAIGLGFKMLLAPLLLYFVYLMVTPSRDLIFNVTIFEAAMPPMITGAIVAAEYKHEPDLAAILVGLGVIISFVSLTAWWRLALS